MYHKRYTYVRLQMSTKLFCVCTIYGTGVSPQRSDPDTPAVILPICKISKARPSGRARLTLG